MYVWMSGVTCDTYEWGTRHISDANQLYVCATGGGNARKNEPCHTYEWAMSHIWMSRVTHMNESCHTYEWVMSHIWMNESCLSCQTYQWGMCDMSSEWSMCTINEVPATWMRHVNEACTRMRYMKESYHTWISHVTYTNKPAAFHREEGHQEESSVWWMRWTDEWGVWSSCHTYKWGMWKSTCDMNVNECGWVMCRTKSFLEYWGCRTRQPGRTWLTGPWAVLVLI